MSINLRRTVRAIRAFAVLTILTGGIYTLVITAIGQLAFPAQANGSLIQVEGKVIGSTLLSQPQSDPKYLWGRTENTDQESFPGYLYQGPTNAAVTDQGYRTKIRERAQNISFAVNREPSIDLITGSGSGFDPHISKAAALAQAPRIAQIRGIKAAEVVEVIQKHTQENFGLPITNVLGVNLELDGITK